MISKRLPNICTSPSPQHHQTWENQALSTDTRGQYMRQTPSITSSSIQHGLIELNSILQYTIPHTLSVRIRSRIIRRRRLPVRPVQPPHPRSQHRKYPPSNQTKTDRPIRVAIQRLPRILRITLQPNMIPRDDLRLS